MESKEKVCPACSSNLGGRWGTRCYTCYPGGTAKTGEDRNCKTCGNSFYVPGWKLKQPRGQNEGTYCSKPCMYASMRFNGSDNSLWARKMFNTYGLTVEEYRRMESEQNGVCAICLGPPNGQGAQNGHFHVDHCHDSNRVRGLLCSKCNTAIGLLDDDTARALRAAEYLKEG